jgi:nicotinamide mononucleotide adenylyltransferase
MAAKTAAVVARERCRLSHTHRSTLSANRTQPGHLELPSCHTNMDGPDWPLEKIRAQLLAFEQLQAAHAHATTTTTLPIDAAPPHRRAILLATGSLCPVHRGHIEQMECARKRLRQEGYQVLGAFLSPTHDGYVLPKMTRMRQGKPLAAVFADVTHRCAMVAAACRDSDWICCSPWEARQPGFADFPLVIAEAERAMRAAGILRPAQGDVLAYVCGSDHFLNCVQYYSLHCREQQIQRHVVVVPRSADDLAHILQLPQPPESNVHIGASHEDKVVELASSTLVRDRLHAGQDVSDLVPPAVVVYLATHRLFSLAGPAVS